MWCSPPEAESLQGRSGLTNPQLCTSRLDSASRRGTSREITAPSVGIPCFRGFFPPISHAWEVHDEFSSAGALPDWCVNWALLPLPCFGDAAQNHIVSAARGTSARSQTIPGHLETMENSRSPRITHRTIMDPILSLVESCASK